MQNKSCFISEIGWNPASSYFTLLSNIYSDLEFVEQVQTMDWRNNMTTILLSVFVVISVLYTFPVFSDGEVSEGII